MHFFSCTTLRWAHSSYQYYRGSPPGQGAPSGNLAIQGSRLHFVSSASQLKVQSTSSASWRPFSWYQLPQTAPLSRPWRSQPEGFSLTGDIRMRYSNTHTRVARWTVKAGAGYSLHHCSCFRGVVDVTSVQGPSLLCRFAQLVVKLELQNKADEISAKKWVAAVISTVLDTSSVRQNNFWRKQGQPEMSLVLQRLSYKHHSSIVKVQQRKSHNGTVLFFSR